MKQDMQLHPADTLARAIDRAASLLGTMGDLYNPATETFSGGNTFLVHALSTASSLIVEARTALDDLHYSCDLTVLEQAQNRDVAIELSTVGATTVAPATDDDWRPETDPDQNAVAPLASPVTTDVVDHEEPFAQSYLELLRKLTAAEVFAAEQQALSAPGTAPELLPLLRSLREDLQKIHSAA